MNDELKQLNEKYEEISLGIYPFMNKSKINSLKKGFYQKKDAEYRGISFIFDKIQERHKALLIGYFYVPKDYIIIPEGIEITEGKRRLIEEKVNKGYEVILVFPSLKPYEFNELSEEYRIAKIANENYKSKLL